VKLNERGSNLGESFILQLPICPVLARCCGTLGKALVLWAGLCGFAMCAAGSAKEAEEEINHLIS